MLKIMKDIGKLFAVNMFSMGWCLAPMLSSLI